MSDKLYPWGMMSAEQEARVRGMFPWESMAPEEYVARHSHNIMVFSYQLKECRDKSLERWLHRVGDLLRDAATVGKLRRQYLTAEEVAAIEAAEASAGMDEP